MTTVSVFLPWYKDLDRFNIGATFLGITGPTYLAGFIVMLTGITAAGLTTLKLMNRPSPRLPMTENHFHIFSGALAVLMLVLSLSIYYHSKFGINLTEKSMGIGMILAFIGSGMVILGGVLGMRKKEVSFEEEGHIEPLIEIQDYERERQNSHINRESTIEEAMEADKWADKDTTGEIR